MEENVEKNTLYDEVCKRATYHSLEYQKIVLSSFSKNGFIQDNPIKDMIKDFLIDLARNK
jgi:hypothetical protein